MLYKTILTFVSCVIILFLIGSVPSSVFASTSHFSEIDYSDKIPTVIGNWSGKVGETITPLCVEEYTLTHYHLNRQRFEITTPEDFSLTFTEPGWYDFICTKVINTNNNGLSITINNNYDIVINVTSQDTDGDGITDYNDSCPNVSGNGNDGCLITIVPLITPVTGDTFIVDEPIVFSFTTNYDNPTGITWFLTNDDTGKTLNFGNTQSFTFTISLASENYKLTVNYYTDNNTKIMYRNYPLTIHPVEVIPDIEKVTPDIEKVTPPVVNNKPGSSYNPPPTLGVNHEVKRLVENGFSYNGNVIDVEYYHTEYPLITTSVGKTNTVELVIFENGGINHLKWVQLFLGVKEIGQPNSLAEVGAQLILSNTQYEDLIVTDKQNLIENMNVTSIEPVKCKASSNSISCLKVIFEYEYREAPLYNVMAINLMDSKRSSWTHFFNDGVEVLGDSINEPLTDYFQHKAGNQHPMITYELTRTDKVNNIWMDQNNIKYLKDSYGNYKRITPPELYQCNDKPLHQIMNGGDRNNCHWRAQLPHIWS